MSRVVLLADIASTGFSGAESAESRIVTTLCPGGKERMRRLMELVLHARVNLEPLLTHTFPLTNIVEAYALFGERHDGVLKVAIQP